MLNYLTEKIFKGNKMLAFYTIGILGMLILILIIVFVVNLSTGGIKNYSELENELISSAEKYYRKNEQLLPKDDNTVSVTVSTLVENKFLKPLDELYKKDDTCDGEVLVSKSGEDYLYTAKLKCDEYVTKTLKDEIISKVVTSGDGLYLSGDEYLFRGEYVNNYIEFDNKLWQILSIDNNGIRMFLSEGKLEKYVWDDRYNVDKRADYGKNIFATSRVNEYLNKFFEENKFVSSKYIKYLVPSSWCIGKIKEQTQISKIDLCNEMSEKSYIGLFEVTDFAKASLESTCKNFDDIQCINYNYLANLENTNWTLNASNENTYDVYAISFNGAEYYRASKEKTITPVVYLNSNTIFSSGNGEKDDPYIIK